jgi:hypothetical protein
LRELAAADSQCPVILMARGASVDAAIEALKAGALDTRNADICIIAATNRDLLSEVADGRFRSDLCYRLGSRAVSSLRSAIKSSACCSRSEATRPRLPTSSASAGGAVPLDRSSERSVVSALFQSASARRAKCPKTQQCSNSGYHICSNSPSIVDVLPGG